jgi:hypothetical protein
MPEIYLGNQNLKAAGVNVEYTQEQVQEYIKCATNHLYFIKKYTKIVSVDEGLVPFSTWDFQDKMVKTFENNRFSICKLPRQVGKTTTVGAYILWKALFTEDYNIAILANKRSQAIEILSRIQLMYEHLPKWLQQGVLEWNKASIKLENGTEIIASSTSSSAIRGTSQNLIYLDEFAFVPNNIQEEFFTSVFPTISSGKTSKVIVTSTPNGMNLFYKLWVDSEEGRNDYERVEIHWSDVPGRDAVWRDEIVRNTSEEQFRQEFECEFLGSTNTLIHPTKLRALTFRSPLYEKNNFKCYEEADRDKTYVIVVDTSRGLGQDYSAFVVFDITEYPYKGVGLYRSKDISPMLYPDVIFNAAKKYNNAFVLIEINDIGEQVSNILFHDFEYENVFRISQRSGAQYVTSGFGGGRSQIGVRTTKSVKRLGCSTLKDMVEQDKLIFEDYDYIAELCNFVQIKESYQAEEGFHDDVVMCTVLFSWLVRQDYFKELTDSDLRKKLYEDNQRMIEEEMLPFGFLDDGHEDDGVINIDTDRLGWSLPPVDNITEKW